MKILCRNRSLCEAHKYRASAFSLIELLVVMAIVSLLAALLFPAFFTARGQARQMVCASHLHQIGLGIAMYGQDYNGLYPYAVDPMDRAYPDICTLILNFKVQFPVYRQYRTV